MVERWLNLAAPHVTNSYSVLTDCTRIQNSQSDVPGFSVGKSLVQITTVYALVSNKVPQLAMTKIWPNTKKINFNSITPENQYF